MNQALDCAIAVTVHNCKSDATLYPKEVVGITKEYHFNYQVAIIFLILFHFDINS